MKKEFLKIEKIQNISLNRKMQIMKRCGAEIEKVLPKIKGMADDICKNRDNALLRYTKKYDGIKLKTKDIMVKKAEIRKAYDRIQKNNPELLKKMQDSLDCITMYHKKEKERMRDGSSYWQADVKSRKWADNEKFTVGQLILPIERIGLYVPGGNAVLFSTALMGVTPAKVAGVREIVVASPPSRNGDIDPRIIVAADLAGADTILRIGGAQAILSLAMGTKIVPKVNKIFGPGNIFVTAAKSYVSSAGICAIDFIAGPSEIMVIADESAEPDLISIDMISQSGHDPNSCAVLVTTDLNIAKETRKYILNKLGRETDKLTGIAKTSLSNFGAIVIADNLSQAFDFSNEFAPEHLEIMTKNAGKWLYKVKNAGTVCIGAFSTVAISDYLAPNHILPTGGAARYTSGINVGMFLKKPSILRADKFMMPLISETVKVLSIGEGLYSQHGRSLELRAELARKRKKT